MKNTRTQLIEQAARDHADEGTEWMQRMDRWLGLEWEALGFVDPRTTPLIEHGPETLKPSQWF